MTSRGGQNTTLTLTMLVKREVDEKAEGPEVFIVFCELWVLGQPYHLARLSGRQISHGNVSDRLSRTNHQMKLLNARVEGKVPVQGLIRMIWVRVALPLYPFSVL